jgi:hypothetical protein
MAVAYGKILLEAGLRVNALVGATSSTLETTLTNAVSAASFDSADFPLTALKDTCLLVEEKLVIAAASFRVKEVSPTGVVFYRHHPWRSSISSATSNLAHKAPLPSVDSSSNKIVGVWGDVYDSSDGTALDEWTLSDIQAAVRNANSWVITPQYGYRIIGNRIHHTRTNVIIDVCTYNRTTRQTAIDTLTNPTLLPDAAEEAMVCGIVSMLIRDDAFTAQSQIYRNYFNEALAGQLAQAA